MLKVILILGCVFFNWGFGLCLLNVLLCLDDDVMFLNFEYYENSILFCYRKVVYVIILKSSIFVNGVCGWLYNWLRGIDILGWLLVMI